MRNIDGSISQNTDEGSGSKAENRKLQDVSKSEFSWLIDDSNDYVRRKAGQDIDRIICLLCVYICHYIFPF